MFIRNKAMIANGSKRTGHLCRRKMASLSISKKQLSKLRKKVLKVAQAGTAEDLAVALDQAKQYFSGDNVLTTLTQTAKRFCIERHSSII